MKLGLLTAIWKRPRLTSLVLSYYARLRIPGIELLPVAVMSPSDPEKGDWTPGWTYAVAANDPLGKKWIRGMRALEPHKPDAVVIVGSDDLLNARYFEVIAKKLKAGHEYINLAGLYFLEAGSGQCLYLDAKRVGGGRCLSASLLDRVNWTPWEPNVNTGLDGSMDRILQLPGVAIKKIEIRPVIPMVDRTVLDIKEHGIVLLGVKTDVNLWSFAHMKKNLTCRHADGPQLLNEHFPEQARTLLQWNRQAA